MYNFRKLNKVRLEAFSNVRFEVDEIDELLQGMRGSIGDSFELCLYARGINTVSDVTSSNNVNVTRLISSDGVEFNIICDLTPISNHIVEVNDNKQLPTTGGSSYVYTIYGIMLLLSSILLSFRKEVIK